MTLEPQTTEKNCYDWNLFAKTPGLKEFGPKSKIEAVDGGTINYVYRITSDKNPKLTVIVKHGEDHVKEFPVHPLPKARTRVEFWGMTKMSELVPGSVPTPYLYHPDQNYIVMEDLGGFDILRDRLNNGNLDLSLLTPLARNIAKLHRSTHRVTTDPVKHQEMEVFCKPSGMQDLGVIHVFVDPIDRKGYGKYEKEVEEFLKDPKLGGHWEKLKNIDRTKSDCLVHGDFHTSSVMIRGSTVKIFDFEFSHMGPAGNDFGHMLANLYKPYLDHKLYPLKEDSTFHERLGEEICELVDIYFKEAREYLNDEEYEQTVSETAGFVGARMIRRVWGLMELGESPNQPLTEKELLRIAYKLISDFEKIRTTRQLKDYMFGGKE
ncbi:5-deoxyribose kinase-like [Patiria miniata]|uniref:Aminoglycoside phosphotransferase domain-containing protein n=1 Tax=Patiria miniata TaxID=46514 RepID=A0A914AFB9_PATMI|nr:5-deoxyribose kinase-like [Patiria miniata]XP_038062070.1 5-deoxyribose kinase-like [Patiria miniata]